MKYSTTATPPRRRSRLRADPPASATRAALIARITEVAPGVRKLFEVRPSAEERVAWMSLTSGAVHAKLGRDVVTDTDVAVEDQLRDALTTAAGWPVIGEERGGDTPADTPYWLVDPICGTRNFASGIPLFSVNVAMVDGGRVTVAVVGDGSTGDVLVAELGRGVWRVRGGEAAAPLSASTSSLVVDVGAWPAAGSGRKEAAGQFADAVAADRWDLRCFSTTLSLALVASGQIAGCVLFAASAAVHVAAGSLLVAEAQGKVTDRAGAGWNPGATSLVCAGDAALHGALLEVFGQTGSD